MLTQKPRGPPTGFRVGAHRERQRQSRELPGNGLLRLWDATAHR
ncbi:hypothetical protein [Actinomadura sp. LOL_011]